MFGYLQFEEAFEVVAAEGGSGVWSNVVPGKECVGMLHPWLVGATP